MPLTASFPRERRHASLILAKRLLQLVEGAEMRLRAPEVADVVYLQGHGETNPRAGEVVLGMKLNDVPFYGGAIIDSAYSDPNENQTLFKNVGQIFTAFPQMNSGSIRCATICSSAIDGNAFIIQPQRRVHYTMPTTSFVFLDPFPDVAEQFLPNDPERIVSEFHRSLHELDTPETRQNLFDWIMRRTDELFSEGKFDECNLVFANVDVPRLSASAITSLLRSTYMARNRLPARTAFMENPAVIEKLRSSRADADDMLRSLS